MLLTSLIAIFVAVAVYFIATGPLALNAGMVFLAAAPLAELWAHGRLVPKEDPQSDSKLRAKRGLIFAYECLIIGLANALAGPHVLPVVATTGAAVLACGQSIILLLAFKNPRILQTFQRPSSVNFLPTRYIISIFFFVGLAVLASTVIIPRAGHGVVRIIPVEFQWPGVALLYAVFGSFALGLAAEHSRGSFLLYSAAVIVVVSSAAMELITRRNWYLLTLSVLSFLILVPGWPRPAEQNPSDAPLKRATETSG